MLWAKTENISKAAIKAGIYSFRNLKEGFLKIDMHQENLDTFEQKLKSLIIKILTEDFKENITAAY